MPICGCMRKRVKEQTLLPNVMFLRLCKAIEALGVHGPTNYLRASQRF